jgi:hypothetical protein
MTASCSVLLPAALRDWIRIESGSSSLRLVAAMYAVSLFASSPVSPIV